MSLTATYDSVLSRIRLSATLLGASATYAVFDRSADAGITWTTLRGGSAVTVTSQNASLDDYEFPTRVTGSDPDLWYRVRSYNASNVLQSTQTNGDVPIPALTSVWLKVPAAPFLNQPVTVADRSEVTRRSRAGLFDIVGRSFPVMVGDVASSIAYTLTLQTANSAAESNLDYLFASGEVVFLQAPASVDYLQTGYFAVGDVSRGPVSMVSQLRRWNVPLTEVAAPGADVIGSAYTWTSALADYASWTALLAANATWSTLLNRTGTPSDVIVP